MNQELASLRKGLDDIDAVLVSALGERARLARDIARVKGEGDSKPGVQRSSLAHLKRLWRFIAPYRGRVVVALIALMIAAGCVLALGQGLRHVIDAGFGSRDPQLLNAALAAVVAVALLLAAATWTRFYLMMSVGERIIADLRCAAFAHVLTLSPAFFDASRTGEISSRITNDTEQIRQVIGFGFSMFLRNGLMMLGALAMLFATSIKLAALIVLAAGSLIAVRGSRPSPSA